MTRPKDIPESVWDAAYEAFSDAVRDEKAGQEIIARAILAERERCVEKARRHMEVHAQVSARSNLVGYAAEFYNAAKFELPHVIRGGSNA